MISSSGNGPLRGRGRFATTNWSIVRAAGGRFSSESRAALSSLCGTYWYPVYAYARRHGLDADRAGDATQGFFTRLIDKGILEKVDPDRGRFRSFLLTAFRNFLADERDRERAGKRGGGVQPLPLDLETAEGRYVREPSHGLTPERIFERRWALTVLERALERLRAEQSGSRREQVYARLEGYLTGEASSVPYARTAADLGMSEIAVKVAVHRLRRRFRGHLVDEITETVTGEADLEEEIRHLLAALETE